ncbi:MAG: YceI family protein [Anaerolineales bacterium]
MLRRYFVLVSLLLAAGALAACSAFSSGPTLAPAPTAASGGGTLSEGQILLQFAPSGNEARYRVREQLANVDLPSDAVGRTAAVSGAIVINADGTIASDQSKVSVDLTGLKSDRSQRDRFLQNNVLQTSTYPTADFVPTGVSGLPSPLPTSGAVTFQLTGDLTVHGVTKAVTWDVTATAADGKDLTGTATTSFTFADFGLTQPRVPVVLSVEDTIKLELDFHLVKGN